MTSVLHITEAKIPVERFLSVEETLFVSFANPMTTILRRTEAIYICSIASVIIELRHICSQKFQKYHRVMLCCSFS